MDGENRPGQEEHLTAGQSFVRSIRPLGCALFLIIGILGTVLCFTVGRDPIPGYQPPERASYENDLPRLAEILQTQVFPKLPDNELSAAVTGDTVTVTVASGNFAVARAAILRYFPEDLIEFAEGG